MKIYTIMFSDNNKTRTRYYISKSKDTNDKNVYVTKLDNENYTFVDFEVSGTKIMGNRSENITLETPYYTWFFNLDTYPIINKNTFVKFATIKKDDWIQNFNIDPSYLSTKNLRLKKNNNNNKNYYVCLSKKKESVYQLRISDTINSEDWYMD